MSAINLISEVPGPKSKELIARREAATVSGMALLTPVAIDHALGALVTDLDGNTLIDFAGGIGALALGHCPPQVTRAMQKQAEKLIHTCALVASYEPFVEVVELLNRIAPGPGPKRSALLNSGAEAVEAAVKGGPLLHRAAGHNRVRGRLPRPHQPHPGHDQQIRPASKKGFGPFAPEIYRLPFAPNPYRRPDEISEEAFIDFYVKQLEYAMVAPGGPPRTWRPS